MQSYVQVRVITEAAEQSIDAVADAIKTPSGFKKTVKPGAWTHRGVKNMSGAKVVTLASDDVQVHLNLSQSHDSVEASGHTLLKVSDGWALLRGRGAKESFYSDVPSDLDYLVKKQLQMAAREKAMSAPKSVAAESRKLFEAFFPNIGDPVEWTSSGGGVMQGVVAALPKTRGARLKVTSTDGKHWNVPPSMLRPAKIDKAQMAKTKAVGDAFQAKKDAHKSKQVDRNVQDGQRAIDMYGYKPGMRVRYKGSEVAIKSVDAENGKLTIENPKQSVKDFADIFGLPSGHLSKISKAVTVWAYMVRP